ncbi:biotin--[acetyl-CoA-carboxylase] ligase [Luedemannella helvata]|uniref:biotin--[biotin carboxyl-carrier protein] ligase n=1 Tax=Luedemannella helvata TaxID=349315 RepID=A0ABP4VSX8_9ACTN
MADSPYTDLDRPPLREAALRRALLGDLWTDVRVVARTGSTNADVAVSARDGAPEGLVLVAEQQDAGRGRLGRSWVSPARAGLAVSVLLRPTVPLARWNWLPLLAGVALAEAVGRVGVVDAVLKWPNDLLVRSATAPDLVGPGYGKCAGLLAEVVPGGAVVLGIGLNVHQRVDELPPPGELGALPPVSLALAGALCTDRDPLLRALLRAVADWYARWTEADGDPVASGVREAYLRDCVTVGADVRVSMPDGSIVAGRASDVDLDGRLVVLGAHGDRHAVAAGDVRHVR